MSGHGILPRVTIWRTLTYKSVYEVGGELVKLETIKKHLRSQKISSRRSTLDSTFAAALAPHDEFNREIVAQALEDLEQDPQGDLSCTYCGEPAATWDHLFSKVKNREFSGYGHSIRNLVPSCRTCNERKGGKTWQDYLAKLAPADIETRTRRLEKFLTHSSARKIEIDDFRRVAGDEYERFNEIRHQIHELINEADELAIVIRDNIKVGEMP
jgi:5-methylcytosine-specific restriction endonuclease McrA